MLEIKEEMERMKKKTWAISRKEQKRKQDQKEVKKGENEEGGRGTFSKSSHINSTGLKRR